MENLPLPLQEEEGHPGWYFSEGKEMGIRGRKESEGFVYEAEIAY